MRGTPGRPVVLADVARLAGTSEATASRALKNDSRIGLATRDAVRAAAQKLGYVPNAAARSLRARRTHILGLLLDDLADPVHGQVAAGFEAAAAARGYAVFIMTGLHDAEREQRALRAFAEHRADGVAVASCVSHPRDVHARFPAERVVFVQPEYPELAAGERPPSHGVLRADDAGGVASMVRHLVDRGYSRIGYVGPGVGASDSIRRATAVAVAGELAVAPVREFASGIEGWRDASAVARDVAREVSSGSMDALLCYDDKLAVAMLDGLRTAPLDIPADLAVTGFDGIAATRLSMPRLTTVAVPSVALGHRAVEMLATSVLDGVLPESEVVPVSLVIRESTPERGSAVSPSRRVARAGLER